MDLCTVISEKFIPQAINLIQSYKINSFNKKVYLYSFNTDKNRLKIFKDLFSNQVVFREVPEVCKHALEPRAFFYKVYAINDCLLNNTTSMIYSDSANCFVNRTTGLETDLVDQSLFMVYRHPGLSNKYWATKKCFEKMAAIDAEPMPQYWAGFQAYKRSTDNVNFVTEMYDYMLDPEIALPDTTVKRPDGENGCCIEHRQDQSVLSLLINKHGRHQFFDINKNAKYGDWQTIVDFDSSYVHNFNEMVLSPRESKFGNFRYITR